MRRTLMCSALLLVCGGCVVHADDSGCDGDDEVYDCYVEYRPGYGYQRVCDVVDPLVCIELGDDDEDGPRPRPLSESSAGTSGQAGSSGAGGAGGSTSSGSGTAGAASGSADPDAFDFPCARDAQCGTGLCIEGECFYGCAADTDCGTADTCTAVGAVNVCQASDDPAISCTRSAECGFEQVCLNAACHDSCELTSDCNNELDRCVAGVCVPDRRVVAECLLDRECPSGQVCIDAACQAL
jgi:hypothetical protein